MVKPVNGFNVWQGVLVSVFVAFPVSAQARAFPSVEAFDYPAAGPRATGIVGRVVQERLGDSRFGPEREADVWVGANLPLLSLSGGNRPAFLGLTMRVGGRFSLDDPRSSLISNDWVVGGDVCSGWTDI